MLHEIGMFLNNWGMPLLFGITVIEGIVLWKFKPASWTWKSAATSYLIMAGQPLFNFLVSFSLKSFVLTQFLAKDWLAELVHFRFQNIELNFFSGTCLLLAIDFLFYLRHRLRHSCRWFWAEHVVHHSSKYFNLATSYRLGWTAGITTSIIFDIPLVLAGFKISDILILTTIHNIYQHYTHLNWVGRLGILEWLFVTPSNHRVHHATNPLYIDKNFGGMFIIFDLMFGTFQKETEPCVYGLVGKDHGNNILKILFYEWYSLFKDARQERSLRAVLSCLFGAPHRVGRQNDSPKTFTESQVQPSIEAS